MLGKLKQIFQGAASLQVDASGQASDEDLQVATGVLLLEMAGSDEDYAPEEIQAIFQTMQKEFGIEEEKTMDLLDTADQLRDEKEKIDDFVKTLNAKYSAEQRGKVLSMVWKVIVADGQVDKFEQRFAAQLKARLQLSDEQAEQAKQAALSSS